MLRFLRRNRYILLRAVVIAALTFLGGRLSWGWTPVQGDWSLRLPGLTLPYAALFLGSVWPGAWLWGIGAVLGRVFCAWVCPLGLFTDLAERVLAPIRRRLPVRLAEPPLSVHHALFWAAIPYGALVNGLPLVLRVPETWRLLITLVFFLAPLGLGMLLINAKVPCRYFCTILGIGALPSPLAIRCDTSRCTGCRRCERACTWRVRLLEPGNLYDKMYCTRCGLCLDACEKRALGWKVGWTKGASVKGEGNTL